MLGAGTVSLTGASILVTGGSGTFGNAFARLVLTEHSPSRLIILSRDEWKQQQMRETFRLHDGLMDDPRLRFFLGDVRDPNRLRRAFAGVDVVIHAAALKQVPACEYNPWEAVQTNVLGAQHVIEAAIDCGVRKVLALSSDKAVNPINLYGATKLCMEKLFQQANVYAKHGVPAFSCVRYGNVIGSRGSVLSVWREQAKTGTLTVTDGAMTRFWLTPQDGVRFVLRCLERMRGGEVFVPKLPAVGMKELADAVCPDCAQEQVGIRAGEKRHEVLVSRDESHLAEDFGDYFVVRPALSFTDAPTEHGFDLHPGFEYRSDEAPRVDPATVGNYAI